MPEQNLLLKAFSKLNYGHIHPTNYGKMNVAKAYQFFSRDVAMVIELYYSTVPELADSEPTRQFIHRVINTITRLVSVARKVLSEKLVKKKKQLKNFSHTSRSAMKKLTIMTSQTRAGLKATSLTALRLTHYLINKRGFTCYAGKVKPE